METAGVSHDESPHVSRVLLDRAFWSPRFEVPGEELALIEDAVDADDERAARLSESLLCRPATQWRELFRATPGARTAAMVRQMLARMPAMVERRPADALELTSLAIAIAEALPEGDWPDEVLTARGQALRDHAYVLSFVGRYHEALAHVERAERTFAQFDAVSFDLARLALVKAAVLRVLNRSDEALRLTREAATIFLRIDEPVRYLNARITEGAVLYDAGAVQEALQVFQSLQRNPDLDAVGELRVLHNIATCLCDLGRQDEAVSSLERCIVEFSRLGMLPQRARSRWYLGNALLGAGQPREAVSLLRAAWYELLELDVVADAALAALDLAEALLGNGQPSEVPAICRQVIAQLTNAGLSTRAIHAVSLLREAAAQGNASRDLVRSTHATVRMSGQRAPLGLPQKTVS